MAWILPVISGFLWRLDGVGDTDTFLPFWPFNWKGRGINYARYAIGVFIAVYTWNWVYILTYAIAASISYGEKHWWMKLGLVSWFFIGAIWGAASFNLYFTLWCGVALAVLKLLDTNQAILEFVFGGMVSLIHILK